MDFKHVFQAYKVPIILGAASLLFIVLSITLLIKSYQSPASIEFSSDQASSSAQLVVDVAGAVVSPGVYSLPIGSRLQDAIVAAGGLTDEADSALIAKSVNRAAKLIDGAKLYIPEKGSGLLNAQGQTPLSGATSINSASQGQLEALPGIGPVTAKKIIDGRPYMSLEELVSKNAIGQSLFNKLKGQLTL